MASVELRCPAPGCDRQRRSVDELACPRCWFRLSRSVRQQVWHAYRAYLRNRIGIEQLRDAQRRAIATLSPLE